MRFRIRLWVPGVVCLLGGYAGRVALGWYGIRWGRVQYAEIAGWQLAWYGFGLALIAIHLTRRGRTENGPRESQLHLWLFWWVAVLVSGVLVLSSCPP